MATPAEILSSPFGRSGHAGHCSRCLQGLPDSQLEMDASRVAIGFYSLGSLDLLGLVDKKTSETQRQGWKDWIWEQQSPSIYGTGFKGSSYMATDPAVGRSDDYAEYDTPNLIMTYTAVLALAILRDDMKRLDRQGLVRLIRACQRADGSFSALPNGGEADLRCMYCAFVLSSIIHDWSGIDLEQAIDYVRQCESYEGGYGQTPFGEALGGTTYCALASLQLLPPGYTASSPPISSTHRARTIRWLMQNQGQDGGFAGRTNKLSDACYCFWCGASLAILDATSYVDIAGLSSFLAQCQFKFGGIAKAPGSRADPYHTYMSLAALAIYPPPEAHESWALPRLNFLWNTTEETAEWLIRSFSE